jgi:hypothetical protein
VDDDYWTVTPLQIPLVKLMVMAKMTPTQQ